LCTACHPDHLRCANPTGALTSLSLRCQSVALIAKKLRLAEPPRKCDALIALIRRPMQRVQQLSVSRDSQISVGTSDNTHLFPVPADFLEHPHDGPFRMHVSSLMQLLCQKFSAFFALTGFSSRRYSSLAKGAGTPWP